QFFIVYGDSQLDPNYTVLGTVTAGLDVVDGIAAKGVSGGGQDGAPAEKVTITSVTISEAPAGATSEPGTAPEPTSESAPESAPDAGTASEQTTESGAAAESTAS